MTTFNKAVNLLRKLQAQGYLEPHEFDLLYEALKQGELYRQKAAYYKRMFLMAFEAIKEDEED